MRTLVLTEDSGADAHDVIRGVLRCMFRFIDGQTQTQRIEFEPANAKAKAVMQANGWEDKTRRELVDLRRAIAEKLVEGGFVFFHFDGDQIWSRRQACKRPEKFRKMIVEPVRIILQEKVDKGRLGVDEVHERLKRLHAITPFYSIEAWLFQNEREACRLCRKEGAHADHTQFVTWAADRKLLDEVDQPKEQVGFKDKHNLALTVGFPTDAVWQAGQSFAAAIDALLADDALLAALKGTQSSGP